MRESLLEVSHPPLSCWDGDHLDLVLHEHTEAADLT